MSDYLAFVEKFKPRLTTDDCYTPELVYSTIVEWACERYDITPAQIVRPFWPGADYTCSVYPPGCVVLDNPPFSILAKILRWYNERKIKFFLFAPALTILSSIRLTGGVTAICTAASVTYKNGAAVSTSFVTNLEDDNIVAMSHPQLYKIVKKANDENQKSQKKQLNKLALPNEVITSARLSYFSIHGTAHRVRRDESTFIATLDNYQKGIFGNGLLLSSRAAAERAAAERAAAERAAAERAAAENAEAIRVTLSDRERELQKMIDKKGKSHE